MNNSTIKNSISAFLIAFIIAFTLTSCDNDPSKKIKSENVDKSQERINTVFEYPTIKFDKTNHDFGEIRDGDIVETVFTFTNSGDSDLKILSVSSASSIKPEFINGYSMDTKVMVSYAFLYWSNTSLIVFVSLIS